MSMRAIVPMGQGDIDILSLSRACCQHIVSQLDYDAESREDAQMMRLIMKLMMKLETGGAT